MAISTKICTTYSTTDVSKSVHLYSASSRSSL